MRFEEEQTPRLIREKHVISELERLGDDWVNECLFDLGVERDSYDKELVKKILRFGYYTGAYTVLDFEPPGTGEDVQDSA